MKAYSQDLRQRVLKAIDAGQSQERSCVAGSLAPSVRSSSRRKARRALPDVRGHIWSQGQSCQHQSRQDGFGVDTKKKSLRASEQDEAERAAWREQARQLSGQDLVIVDETGSRINMTPLYSYAPRGKRAIGTVPRNYGANLTLIASLSLQGMGEAMVLDGSADAAAFEVYAERILAPSLRPGQIVILDNLSVHLGPRVKQAIEKNPASFCFCRRTRLIFSRLREPFPS